MGQAEEKADPPVKHEEGIAESFLHFVFRALDYGGIGNAPVSSHQVPRPNRTDLTCSVVADAEVKVELWGIWPGEFIPNLAAKPAGRNMCDFKFAQCLRAH